LISDPIRLTQHRKDFYIDKNAVGFTPVDWLDKNKPYIAIDILNRLKWKYYA
jgi:hypothetical protein